MTREEREEVIAELKYARAMTEFNPMTGEVCFRNDEDKRQAKAFDMAIEIMKQEPILDNIRAEVMNLTDGEKPERVWNVDVLQIIDKYKAESEVENADSD